MENIKDRILKFLHLDEIVKNLSGYVEARVALMKLEIRDEVGGILSRGLMVMLIFMIGFLFVLFLFIGLAELLNVAFESRFLGYLLMALFFGVILAVLLLTRKKFFRMMESKFVEVIKQRQE